MLKRYISVWRIFISDRAIICDRKLVIFPLFLPGILTTVRMDKKPAGLSFDNTENAFAYKSDMALKKADFLFSSMGHAWLVHWGPRVTPWIIRAGLPVKGIIRNTIFRSSWAGRRWRRQRSLR